MKYHIRERNHIDFLSNEGQSDKESTRNSKICSHFLFQINDLNQARWECGKDVAYS